MEDAQIVGNTDVGKDKTAYIYALIDPRKPEEYRYVGWASNLRRRMIGHMSDARTGDKTYKANWIRKIVSEGYNPEMIVLEECPFDIWAEREIFWIAKAKEDGHPLTNITTGGEGSPGQEWSQESRDKVALARSGQKASPEARRNMSRAFMGRPSNNKGKRTSFEIRMKISAAHEGKHLSEETKRKIGLAHKGKHLPLRGTPSDEIRAKISRRLKGRAVRPSGWHHTEETKRKMSQMKKGKTTHMKGRKHTEESKRKMSETHKKVWAEKKRISEAK
jgi:group I intron endonuclease